MRDRPEGVASLDRHRKRRRHLALVPPIRVAVKPRLTILTPRPTADPTPPAA